MTAAAEVLAGGAGSPAPLRVLVVEDDSQMAGRLTRALREQGHDCDTAADGAAGDRMARDGSYDVLVVDRMLPERDGISLVKGLREAGIQTPVLFLSALGDTVHRVEGLRAGGDDYLVKPPELIELLARVDALARRRETGGVQTRLVVADLEMDLLARTVTRAGQRIDLQPREFRLLEFLMRNAGRVVTRTMLLEKVWDYHFDPMTNVIDVHISRLRSKIDREFDVSLLQTVRGAGYRIGAPDEGA
jgi:two-component system OmpR family response regulator